MFLVPTRRVLNQNFHNLTVLALAGALTALNIRDRDCQAERPPAAAAGKLLTVSARPRLPESRARAQSPSGFLPQATS